MTDERKQAGKILADELSLDRLTPLQWEGIMRAMESYASLKVSEATKEMYPKEFILWKDENADYDEEDELYFTTTDEMMGIGTWLTFEAVFEYWKQNIRK